MGNRTLTPVMGALLVRGDGAGLDHGTTALTAKSPGVGHASGRMKSYKMLRDHRRCGADRRLPSAALRNALSTRGPG
ncbi:hypothetical protein GCM10010503_38210 [Streptomyces lucensis JCM 4490]|uniref:Uncharacterized protein n=1 Tax=Streptomyces lucensis JCM 4490 TaxID=1306176 RepID=A0A918JBE0_9ACTN|nr:hypothetical protein GCM10010503_38210 [Streptomyces lucensis JCM 4490]